MSLINKVIYDLEDRQALTTDSRGRVFRGLSSAVNLHHNKKILTANLFIVFLFLLASVAGTYAVMEKRADKILDNIEMTDTSTAPANISMPVTTYSENIISAQGFDEVDSQIAENQLKLDFSLSSFDTAEVDSQPEKFSDTKKNASSVKAIGLSEYNKNLLLNLQVSTEVDYRAYTLSNPARVVIEIDNAVFDGDIPDLTSQAGVSDIRVRQDESAGLLVVLDTVDDYSIEKMEMTPSVQGYRLNLSMTPQAISVSEKTHPVPGTQAKAQRPSAPVNAGYGDMEKSISSNNEVKQLRTMYMDARELYRHGKIRQANELLFAILKKNAGHKAARTLLARKLMEQGQLQKAEILLKAGLGIAGGETTWKNLYARLLANKGDVDTAITVLTKAMPAVNSDPEYFAFLAALYQKNERHADAVRTYRQVLQSVPDNSIWWMGLAISLESLQQHADALYAYKMALRGKAMSQDLQKYVHGKINYLTKRS